VPGYTTDERHSLAIPLNQLHTVVFYAEFLDTENRLTGVSLIFSLTCERQALRESAAKHERARFLERMGSPTSLDEIYTWHRAPHMP